MVQAISCSPLSKRIRIGTLNKAQTGYVGKMRDVTSECIGSVVEMIGDGNTHTVMLNDASTYEITVRKIEEIAEQGEKE